MSDVVLHQYPLHPKYAEPERLAVLHPREIELLRMLTPEQQGQLTMVISYEDNAFECLSFGETSPDGKAMFPSNPDVCAILDELGNYVMAEFAKGVMRQAAR